jgi:Spy/CpxP family protein refolding chaperone
MMKKILIPLLLISAMAAVHAQPGRHAEAGTRGPGNGRMIERLQLNDEQQTAIGRLRSEHQKQQIALRAKIATARVEFRELMQADKPDKSAVIAKQDEITRLQGQMKTAMTQFWFDVNAKLTPEQQKMWKQMPRRGMMADNDQGPRHRGFHRGGMMRHRHQPMGDSDVPDAPPQPE